MEIEVELSDAATARMILLSLGYKPVFWYEKYRTEYRRKGWPGLVTLDETPIGVYLELEGAPDWIDRVAETLGYSQELYITSSYGDLFRQRQRRTGGIEVRMAFKEGGRRNRGAGR